MTPDLLVVPGAEGDHCWLALEEDGLLVLVASTQGLQSVVLVLLGLLTWGRFCKQNQGDNL